MAIFKLAHEGKNLRQLRNIVRYNSKNKKGFNSDTNPRLIGVHSNFGYCLNIDDENEYKQLVENFILTADANAQLSSNSRQKYLYEHSVISFSIEDDKKLGMKKAMELAIETAKKYDLNFENLPYMLWPQIDSGKLHFHLVKCYFNEKGEYFKQSFPMKKMNSAVQKIEKNNNLTFTGKNDPNNYIWKTQKNGKKKKIYFPQGNKNNNKIAKNKTIDLKIKIDDKGNIEYINKLTNEKIASENKINSLILKKKVIQDNVNYKIKAVNSENKKLAKTVKYSIWQKYLTNYAEVDKFERSEKIKINKISKIDLKISVKKQFSHINKDGKKLKKSINIKNVKLDHCKNEMKKDQDILDLDKSKNDQINSIKNIINSAYRNSKTSEIFLKKINESDIEACVNIRENGQGGISFNHIYSDISIAGGQVNSYLTFGKIKKNDPELFDLLTGKDPLGAISFKHDHRSNLDRNFNIGKINKNYKQKVNFDGSISIFFHKKDAEKYPYNHNIRVSRDYKTISFGQRTNDLDLLLAYEFAKKSGWKNGVSRDKNLVKSLMKLSYNKKPEELFFFKMKESTLNISDLKDIIGDDLLSKDNLIKLYDSKIISNKDRKEALVFIKHQLKDHKEEITDLEELLKKGHSLKDSIEQTKKIKEKRDREINMKRDQIKEKLNDEARPTQQPKIIKSLAERERDKMRKLR